MACCLHSAVKTRILVKTRGLHNEAIQISETDKSVPDSVPMCDQSLLPKYRRCETIPGHDRPRPLLYEALKVPSVTRCQISLQRGTHELRSLLPETGLLLEHFCSV